MARAPYTGVPDVEPTGPSSANLNIQANPSEFGGLIGQATQRFGAESEQAGSNLFGAAIARQGMNNEADARGASNNFMRDAGTAWAKYGVLSGKAAADAYPQFAQQLEQLQSQHASILASPMAKNDFMNASSYMLNRLMLMGSTHAAEQERSYWQQSHLANIETSSQTGVLMQNDPQSVDTIAHSIADSAAQIVRMKDPSASDQAVVAAQQTELGKYYRQIIESQAARDPGLATQTFNRARDSMDAASIAATDRTLKGINDEFSLDAFAQRHSSIGAPPPPGYQNNVGNIRASNADFQGKGTPYKGFETFPTPELGVKALVDNLQSYANRNGGQVTLASAIARWAPPSENDTMNYIKNVSQQTGIAWNQPLPLNDANAMAVVAKAMTGVEKGHVQFPDEVFQKGAAASVSQHTQPGTYADQYAQILQARQDAQTQFPGRPDLQTRAEARVRQQIMLDDTMSQKYDAALQKQQRDTLLYAENEYVPKILTNPSGVDAKALANDPRFEADPQKKVQLTELLNKMLNSDGTPQQHDVKTYGPGFYDAFQRIHAPQDDPNRITDASQLYSRVGPNGDITAAGLDRLRGELSDKKTPEGEADAKMKAGALAYAKNEISFEKDFGTFKIRDPKGEGIFGTGFTPAFYKAYDDGLKAGKTPYQMLSKDSPDFIVDKLVGAYKRTPAQIQHDMLDENDATGAAPAGGTTAAPAQDLKSQAGIVQAYQKGQIDRVRASQLLVDGGFASPAAPPAPTPPR